MAKAGFNANHPQFSPNGASVLASGGSRASPGTMQLLLYRISSQVFSILQLSPKTSLILHGHTAWSPDSSTVLCALTPRHPEGSTRLRMAAVNAESATVTYQALKLAGVCTHVSWGASSYVALACTDVEQESAAVYLCRAAGSPLRLTVLHTLSTGLIITHLSCAPSGLLCSWLEVVDEYWDSTASSCVCCGDYDIDETTASLVVAEFATGQVVEVAELESPAFKWHPMLTFKEETRRAAQAHWAPDGLSLFMLDAAEGCNCSCVQRLVF